MVEYIDKEMDQIATCVLDGGLVEFPVTRNEQGRPVKTECAPAIERSKSTDTYGTAIDSVFTPDSAGGSSRSTFSLSSRDSIKAQRGGSGSGQPSSKCENNTGFKQSLNRTFSVFSIASWRGSKRAEQVCDTDPIRPISTASAPAELTPQRSYSRFLGKRKGQQHSRTRKPYSAVAGTAKESTSRNVENSAHEAIRRCRQSVVGDGQRTLSPAGQHELHRDLATSRRRRHSLSGARPTETQHKRHLNYRPSFGRLRPMIEDVKTSHPAFQFGTGDAARSHIPGAPAPGSFPGAPAPLGTTRRLEEDLFNQRKVPFEMLASRSRRGQNVGWHYAPDQSQMCLLSKMSMQVLEETGNEVDRERAMSSRLADLPFFMTEPYRQPGSQVSAPTAMEPSPLMGHRLARSSSTSSVLHSAQPASIHMRIPSIQPTLRRSQSASDMHVTTTPLPTYRSGTLSAHLDKMRSGVLDRQLSYLHIRGEQAGSQQPRILSPLRAQRTMADLQSQQRLRRPNSRLSEPLMPLYEDEVFAAAQMQYLRDSSRASNALQEQLNENRHGHYRSQSAAIMEREIAMRRATDWAGTNEQLFSRSGSRTSQKMGSGRFGVVAKDDVPKRMGTDLMQFHHSQV